MADRLREIPKKILEWWNKFSPKQKTILVCVVAGIVLAVGIMTYVLTRPQYEKILTCETSKEAAEVTSILESNDINYITSTDTLTISVLKEQVSQANLVLGSNDIVTDTYESGYDFANVTEGGFSTTESDKQKKLVYWKQTKMEKDLETNPTIKKAHVTLTIPEDDGTLIAQSIDASASVVLELEGELSTDAANAIAHFIATALGNQTTDHITMIDSMGNLLFSGEIQSSESGNASTQFAAKQEAENLVKSEVKSVLLGTNLYDNIEVASNLSLDFSVTEKVDHTYTPAEDQTQGVLASEDIYNSESTGGVAGQPGTDSNANDTTYVFQNDANSSQTVSEESRKFLPNESVTKQTIPPGLIKYSESSVSVTAKKLHLYKEDEVKAQGLLTDITWDEFKVANGDQVKLEVDEDIYNIVHTATGIDTANITIVAYEVPMFLDAEGSRIKATDIITVLLIIAILGLLAFVVIRSMQTKKEVEEAPEELSVEGMLQSMPQEELEDIELSDKSEARKLIEKFVDENPEAVANLLRNWLMEDWG